MKKNLYISIMEILEKFIKNIFHLLPSLPSEGSPKHAPTDNFPISISGFWY